MRILHIYKNYYPVLGGIENHIKLIAEEFAKLPGWQIQVLATNGSFRNTLENINGVEVIKSARLCEVASTPLSISMLSAMRALKPDVIHYHFPYPPGELLGWYSFGRTNCKFVVTYHSDVVRQAGLMRLYNPLFGKFLSRVSTVVASTPNYVESSATLRGIPSTKIKIIPFGIDLKQYKNPGIERIQAVRKKYGGPLITFIGKLRYYKGLEFLIRAAADVDANFLIIGDGPTRRAVEKLILECGLYDRVHLLGEIEFSELVDCLYASDIFVLPSVLRSEAFGIAILEAMACGLPVISTELGTGTSYANQNGVTGLVVRPRDVNSLAEAINMLLKNPVLKAKLGENARKRVEELFCKEIMIKRIKEVYEE